ncbi:ABC transporter ATP-binding protein [Microbacterium sp. G2-8]|uniref:ABC transporter ATP-binding protein n=1 Tax=Microbacterium sp. G2-8 TaxID=2842454 RepID=UPI001C8AADC4|nr:ABC transporter ATP-binding protein [Microbacterium sp. G2-8]
MNQQTDPLLTVDGLRVAFTTAQGESAVVKNLSFSLPRGGSLGIVGESGSGKSMTSLAIMGLLPKGGKVSGAIDFDGVRLTDLPEKQMRRVRGDRIAMIFQDPLSSLNPYYRVGMQIEEAYRSHRPGASRKEARKVAIAALQRVRIRDAETRIDHYPHQFSGGMRQRIMIAMALTMEPDLIIADEPTTALDVTVQAQILDLLAEIREETGASLILITHDLAVVSEVTDDIIVLREGDMVEQGPTEQIFCDPQHVYTRRLLDAVPRIDDEIGTLRTTDITTVGEDE